MRYYLLHDRIAEASGGGKVIDPSAAGTITGVGMGVEAAINITSLLGIKVPILAG